MSYICQQSVKTQHKEHIMKKILMITIAVFTIASCAVIDKNMVTQEDSKTTDSGNIAENLVSLINGYTDKINAVESVYDLFFISEKCYKEKMSFEKENAEDISTFKSTLTEEGKAVYDAAINKAMSEFEAAVNKKAKAFAEKEKAAN